MADRRVTFLVNANIQNFLSNMDKAAKKLQSTGRKMQRVGQAWSAKLTLPILGAGAASLQSAAKFEQLQTSLNVLTGSAEEGSRVFERLKRFSASTPFQLDDIVKANNTMLGFSLSADEAFESIQNIGDIAAVTGGDVQAISVAFGQAAAEGKLFTRDIRQFINQGVPAVDLLADSLGVATSEVFNMAEAGEISFKDLQKAFRDATAEGGQFEDGMAKQSQTLFGLWSTLKDNVVNAMAEMGESISDTFNVPDLMKRSIEGIQNLSEKFRSLSNESRRNIIKIVAGIGLIPPALFGIGTVIAGLGVAFGALTSPITLVIGSIAALGAAILYLRDNWDAVVERISDLGWWRNALISMIQMFIKYNTFGLMIEGFNAVLRHLGSSEIPNPFRALAGTLDGLKTETKEYDNEFGSFSDSIINTLEEMSGFDLREILNFDGAIDGAKELANEVKNVNREFRWAKEMMGIDFAKSPTPTITQGVSSPPDPRRAQGGHGRIRSQLPPAGPGQVNSQNSIQAEMARLQSILGSVTSKSKIETLKNEIADLKLQLEGTSQSANFLKNVTSGWVDSFGQGLSNIIVQGGKFVDILKDMKNLLLSSAIQSGITAFLTGGLGGSGFFGRGGGLFGKIFGVTDAIISPDGNVITTHPDDFLIATKDPAGMANSVRNSGASAMTADINVYLDSVQIWRGQQRLERRRRT